MFVIYEKPVHSPFCGDGIETIVSNKSGKILAHTRGWDDQSVTEDFSAPLRGKCLNEKGPGWRKVTGNKLDLAQDWAREVTN